MARSATQENHDHALLALSSRTALLSLKQLGQGQPPWQRPDLKKIPAAQTVAMKASLVCVNFQHGSWSLKLDKFLNRRPVLHRRRWADPGLLN